MPAGDAAKVVAVLPRPMRAFPGLALLRPSDVPPDLGSWAPALRMPEPLRRELRDLGLL